MAYDRWRTPVWFVSLVGEFDEIGLDPATEHDNPTRARHFFTEQDDGLSRNWTGFGLVFVNPGYSRGTIEKWMDKCNVESLKGAEIIALVNANTDTQWFQRTMATASALCLMEGRIKYDLPPDERSKLDTRRPTRPNAVFYWGRRTGRFVSVFSGRGACVMLRTAKMIYSPDGKWW